MCIFDHILFTFISGFPEVEAGAGVWTLPEKFGTDPPEKKIGPIGFNYLSKEVRKAICEIHF